MKAALVFGLLLVGCAGDDDLCARLCAHERACEPATPAACEATCADGLAIYRADVARPALECTIEVPCGGDDARCWDDALAAVEASAAYHAAVAACHDAEARCARSFDCDDPLNAALIDDVLIAITACFDQACDRVVSCITSAVAPQ
jgi:hypothetical protein